MIDADGFSFASLEELEGIDSVMGLAFENLVVNNYRELIPYLYAAPSEYHPTALHGLQMTDFSRR